MNNYNSQIEKFEVIKKMDYNLKMKKCLQLTNTHCRMR